MKSFRLFLALFSGFLSVAWTAPIAAADQTPITESISTLSTSTPTPTPASTPTPAASATPSPSPTAAPTAAPTALPATGAPFSGLVFLLVLFAGSFSLYFLLKPEKETRP